MNSSTSKVFIVCRWELFFVFVSVSGQLFLKAVAYTICSFQCSTAERFWMWTTCRWVLCVCRPCLRRLYVQSTTPGSRGHFSLHRLSHLTLHSISCFIPWLWCKQTSFHSRRWLFGCSQLKDGIKCEMEWKLLTTPWQPTKPKVNITLKHRTGQAPFKSPFQEQTPMKWNI